MSSDSEPYGLNEVDDFMKNKEKITFENSTLSKNYKNGRNDDYNEDEEYSDEEVMNIDEEDSSENDEQNEDEDDDEEEESDGDALDGATVYKKLFGKKLRSADDIEEMDDEDDNNWGSTKANYYGADDVSDNEDDAKAMEEEAKKQQQQHMESLNMMDFMDLDDDEEQKNWDKNAKEYDNKAFEGSDELVQVEKQDVHSINNFSEAEKLEFLQAKFPEFIPLFKEYRSLNENLETLDKKLASIKTEEEEELSTVLNIKKTAILSNLASINLYFMILLDNLQQPDNEEFKNMKYHPIMEKILLTKEIVRQADLLPEIQASGYVEEGEEDGEVEEMDENFLAEAALDEDEEEKVGEDEEIEEENSDSEDGSASEASDDELEVEFKSRIQNIKKDDNKGDFIEGEINDVDLEEKNQKKKSLRFYTAKIDKSDRHQADKLIGGDDDIPYKERMFERKQRLLEEARKRGLQKADDFSALNNEDDDEGVNMDEINEINNYDSAEIEDFYNSINKNKKDKKQNRMEAHLLAKQASTEGKLDELKEVLDEDGKRAINYQILKNKGLTPHRGKDNRNSRVKKRKKYEKAQKKLRSMKQVYKGPHDGRYEGEKSGIRKDITKSVKL